MNNEEEIGIHQTLEIFNKIHNGYNYLNEILVYENSRNQTLIIFLMNWLDILAEELHYRLIETQLDYDQPDKINALFLKFDLVDNFEAFQTIQKNLTYFHKVEADSGINEMIYEIQKDLHSKLKNKRFFIETVSEYNFSEEAINVPETDRPLSEEIEQTFSELPNILAMTSIYHGNPLMWPLIAHELGHFVFKSNLLQDFINDYISEIIPSIVTANIPQDTDINFLARKIFAEIFSDLFALKVFGSVYIVAFYFHEIIGKTEEELFGAKEKDRGRWVGHTFKEHPPSLIRIILMCEEMKKIDLDDDRLFLKLLDIENDICCYCSQFDNMDGFESKYETYKVIYQKASEMINLPDIEIIEQYIVEDDTISQLTKQLSLWLPIPVTRQITRSMLVNSFENNEIIGIDKTNNIRDIIYAGWIHLISEIMPSVENSSNRDEELILKKPSRGTYSWKYNFLLQNLLYSINTSTIVKNFEEED